jgi:hypothetical protein
VKLSHTLFFLAVQHGEIKCIVPAESGNLKPHLWKPSESHLQALHQAAFQFKNLMPKMSLVSLA